MGELITDEMLDDVRGGRRARGASPRRCSAPLRRRRSTGCSFYAPYQSDPDRWAERASRSSRRAEPQDRRHDHRGSCIGPKWPSPGATSSAPRRKPVDDHLAEGGRDRVGALAADDERRAAHAREARVEPVRRHLRVDVGLVLGPALQPHRAVRLGREPVVDVRARAPRRRARRGAGATRSPRARPRDRARRRAACARADGERRVVGPLERSVGREHDRLVAPQPAERPGPAATPGRGARPPPSSGPRRRIAGSPRMPRSSPTPRRVGDEAVPVVPVGRALAVAVAAEVERPDVPAGARSARATGAQVSPWNPVGWASSTAAPSPPQSWIASAGGPSTRRVVGGVTSR